MVFRISSVLSFDPMDIFPINELVGGTIKHMTVCLEKKNSIIIKLDNDLELLMKIPKITVENKSSITTKNRKSYDFMKIQNIKVKDITWYSSFSFIEGLMIIDYSGNVYRIKCKQSSDCFSYNVLFNYTKYLRKKEEKKNKINKLFFKKESYTKI